VKGNPVAELRGILLIKGWSRKKKEALIKENFDLLSKLSKNKTDSLDPPSTSSG
jgi:hypothetical protein